MMTLVSAPVGVVIQCHEHSESSKHRRHTSNIYIMFIDKQNMVANHPCTTTVLQCSVISNLRANHVSVRLGQLEV